MCEKSHKCLYLTPHKRKQICLIIWYLNHFKVNWKHGEIVRMYIIHTVILFPYFLGNGKVFPGFPGNKVPGNTATLVYMPLLVFILFFLDERDTRSVTKSGREDAGEPHRKRNMVVTTPLPQT